MTERAYSGRGHLALDSHEEIYEPKLLIFSWRNAPLEMARYGSVFTSSLAVHVFCMQRGAPSLYPCGINNVDRPTDFFIKSTADPEMMTMTCPSGTFVTYQLRPCESFLAMSRSRPKIVYYSSNAPFALALVPMKAFLLGEMDTHALIGISPSETIYDTVPRVPRAASSLTACTVLWLTDIVL